MPQELAKAGADHEVERARRVILWRTVAAMEVRAWDRARSDRGFGLREHLRVDVHTVIVQTAQQRRLRALKSAHKVQQIARDAAQGIARGSHGAVIAAVRLERALHGSLGLFTPAAERSCGWHCQ